MTRSGTGIPSSYIIKCYIIDHWRSDVVSRYTSQYKYQSDIHSWKIWAHWGANWSLMGHPGFFTRRAKMHWIVVWKVLDLSHLVLIGPTLCPNLFLAAVILFVPIRKQLNVVTYDNNKCVASWWNQTQNTFYSKMSWMHFLIDDSSTVILKHIIQISQKINEMVRKISQCIRIPLFWDMSV